MSHLGTTRVPVSIDFLDSPAVDAFGRLRTSHPAYIFDAQLTYDLQPLLFEQITAQSGATVAHSATNRNALMTFSSTPNGGKAIMQTYEHFRYQPGRSQFIVVTFCFVEGKANCVKFAGYSDGTNGIELQWYGASADSMRVIQYSGTDVGNVTKERADWFDPMDGHGESRLALDFTKQQILMIDLQALYSGRVRLFFDVDGTMYKFCEYENTDVYAGPYMQTANLPVRCGMTCSGATSTTMTYTCCSAVSEGGQQNPAGYEFSVEGTATAGSGARTHILSVRPKTTFNSIENRIKFVLESLSFLVTGVNPVKWELVIGQAISGTTTYNDVNATYSGVEYNTAGTISGNPALVIDSGYVAASGASTGSASSMMDLRYPITLDAAGTVRALGTLTLIVTGIGGASATLASMNWRELR